MIKFNTQKVFTINFRVEEGNEEIYELAKTYTELAKIGKYDWDLNEKIFRWCRIHTLKYVPFKKIYGNFPSFRITEMENDMYFFHLEWALSEEDTDYMF